MDKVEVSILKYLGKVNSGIIVLISITLVDEDFSFDATFYYTSDEMFITITEETQELIGDIKELESYPLILKKCLDRVIPHSQLIDNIDKLDVKPYLNALFENDESDEK